MKATENVTEHVSNEEAKQVTTGGGPSRDFTLSG